MIGVISLTIAQMLEGDDRQVPEGRGPDGPLQLGTPAGAKSQ